MAEALVQEVHINGLLQQVVELKGSDLHLTTGIPPAARVDGVIRPLEGFEPLKSQEIRRMIYGILTQKLRERFESELELDVSHSVSGLGRFRVNVFSQRESLGAVLRVIPTDIIPLDRLGVPAAVSGFAELPPGLGLVTGTTGSGKATTLASLVDMINASRP